MVELNTPERRTPFVWVKDKAGNEFICDRDALKDPTRATPEELRNCIDEAKTPQPFAGG